MVWEASTKQGRGDGHKPWDHVKHPTLKKHTHTHADIQSNTHTHRNTQWTIGQPNACGYTVLHTLMCCSYVEPPAGVQPEQHHSNINNLQWFMSHIEGEKSQNVNWYYFALTQIMFSHAVWKSAVQFTLASGKVSLKYVGSHDSSVKKVLAVHKCVIMTALKNRQNEWRQCSWQAKHWRCTQSFFFLIKKRFWKINKFWQICLELCTRFSSLASKLRSHEQLKNTNIYLGKPLYLSLME